MRQRQQNSPVVLNVAKGQQQSGSHRCFDMRGSFNATSKCLEELSLPMSHQATVTVNAWLVIPLCMHKFSETAKETFLTASPLVMQSHAVRLA